MGLDAVQQAAGWRSVLKLVAPFIKIGANITSQALLERTPLGILDQSIRDNLLGRNGVIARDQQLARITAGTALGGTVIGMAMQGLVYWRRTRRSEGGGALAADRQTTL